MCAIAGIYRFGQPANEPDTTLVGQYLTRIRSRGPDKIGVRRISQECVLGSARLRITDPKNEAADMPFTTPCNSATIVFNGEIYNHRGLRSQLDGFQFQTRSDTETLLAAYLEWGPACLNKLEGMFSFCIADHRTESLFLSVDPLGQKPLYYSQINHTFRFASELSPLLEDATFDKSWNRAAIAELLSQRMIIGGDTHINEIKKLDAGCMLHLNRNELQAPQRYYSIKVHSRFQSEQHVQEAIASAFHESVASMCDLEVGAGIFLSGGLDSSSVFAALCRENKSLPSYTVGFSPLDNSPTYSDAIVADEFAFTEKLTSLYDTKNHQHTLDTNTYFSYWDRWTEIMDEPLCFNETAAHLCLFENAASDCRVIFSGAGADELFDGYGFGAQLTRDAIEIDSVAEAYYSQFNYSFGCDMERLLLDSNTRHRVVSKLEAYLAPYTGISNSVTQLTQTLMVHARLPHSEFRQLDRASMAHSIETRLPFASREFVDTAFSFDPELKSRNETPKYIFRQAMKPFLPDCIVNRPKVPFAPIGQLFFTPQFEERLKELTSDTAVLPDLSIVDMDYVSSLQSSQLPESRPSLTNLVLVNRVLSRQAQFVTN